MKTPEFSYNCSILTGFNPHEGLEEEVIEEIEEIYLKIILYPINTFFTF